MSYEEEFAPVDLLLASCCETRGVDAFALSLIKTERQMRRLLTYLVYQFQCFQQKDVESLREALQRSTKVYFEGLDRGFNGLYPRTIETLIGTEYPKLKNRIMLAGKYRNKIFHGQLTDVYLSRAELLAYVQDIRNWCRALANATQSELAYDGFDRKGSFRKSTISDFASPLKIQFVDVDSYKTFIRSHMEKPRANCKTSQLPSK